MAYAALQILCCLKKKGSRVIGGFYDGMWVFRTSVQFHKSSIVAIAGICIVHLQYSVIEGGGFRKFALFR